MRLDENLTSGISHPIKKSIRKRVIWQVSSVLAIAIFLMGVMAAMHLSKQMQEQMHNLLSNNAHAMQQRFEERLRYLVDSTLLFAKNEFVVNALLDVTKRESYLEPLVKN
ncbi:MAG: hypothetical protein PHI89_04705, partial [Thiovulaceae bacterium]|nr:hypothetical protein [Sulfurimonadaceae bacterium]